jgi:hypothetical protein
MDAELARAIAEQTHAGDREENGAPVLDHIRRVARATPAEARVVAWLHELFEWSDMSEQDLLAHDLTSDELRAIRLLHRPGGSRSDEVYLAHLRLIIEAAGHSGYLARTVKAADLQDRLQHPRVRRDGWSPPYGRALQLLAQANRAGPRATARRDARRRSRAVT